MRIIVPQLVRTGTPSCGATWCGAPRQVSRYSDERLSCPNQLRQSAAPNGKLGGPRGAPKHDVGGFVEICPQHRVTAARDMTGAVHLAGLETLRGKNEI